MFNRRGPKAQIALEFIIVYSFVLVLFLIVFGLIISQRAQGITQEEYGSLQLIAQNIAGYVDQAASAGNGYSATLLLPPSSGALPYNISISTTGIVIAATLFSGQPITADAYSIGRNLNIQGTLNSSLSGNGISVYSIPTASGEISFYNSKGAIYIDKQPVSTLSLPSYMAVNVIGDLNAASFDGVNSHAYASNSVNLGQSSTISMWIYPSNSQVAASSNMISKGTGQPFIELYGNNAVIAGVSGSSNTVPASFTPASWTYIAASYVNGNMINIYTNGNYITNVVAPLSISNTVNMIQLGMAFNGSIADVQLYNSALSNSAISYLYGEGLGGAPLSANSIVAWWPMNGNAQDYSGNGNNAAPYNVSFTNVLQLGIKIRSGQGTNSSGDLFGTVTSSGYAYRLSPNGKSLAAHTNSTGSKSEFVTGNAIGITNVTINAYNYNSSALGNLVGWWPMNSGYGNVIYDLSGSYNNAAFQAGSWSPLAANATELNAASFNGRNSIISGTLSVGSSNITISAWINASVYGTYPQNIASISASNANTEAIGINGIGGNALLSINGQTVISSGALNPNAIYMVTGIWNANNRTVALYINGSLAGSATSNALSNLTVAGFSIGGNYLGINTFNGLISNVQIYDSALSAAQVYSLYRSGLTNAPLAGAGLFGWWPLDNGQTDYADIKAVQTQGGISFRQIRYLNNQSRVNLYVPSFNGISNAITASGYSSLSQMTMAVWFYSSNYTGKTQLLLNSTTGLWKMGFNSANQLYFDPGTTGGGVTLQNTTIKQNTWYQMTVTAQTGGDYTAYLDGVKVGRGTMGSSIGNSGEIVFGAGGFTGQLADAQIYDTALSLPQAQQLYLQGLPLSEKLNVSSS
jgi:hypothetical protein